MSAPGELVSIREFARLDGCSDKLVRNAIKAGKLAVAEDGRLDPALAGTGWRKRNRRAAEGADKGADKPKRSAPKAIQSAPADADVAEAAAEAADELAGIADEDFVAEILAGRFHLLGDAERIKANALAGKHLLAMRREAGDVIDIEVAEAVLFEQARTFRDAWLNWPSRVGPLIAAEIGASADPVVEALNTHVQQLLTDLGEPDPAFAGEQS